MIYSYRPKREGTAPRQDRTTRGIYVTKGGTGSVANTVEVIPENARWEIATKALTGAYIAISNALQQAVGQMGIQELNGTLWYPAGNVAKECADSFGWARETTGHVEGAMD